MAGTQVSAYDYDAWGNLLSVTEDTDLANLNPLRYRGYYYDTETGFYLTATRYYDPETGRFINADSVIAGVGGDILGYNLFAYCFNNPVNMLDSSGNWPTFRQIFAAVVTVAVTAVVVAAVVAAAPAVAGVVATTATFYGASAAVAGALATATTIGCVGVATGVAVTGLNRAIKTVTGTNYEAKVIGEKNYETFESTVNIAAMMITSVPQTTPYPSTGRSEPQNLNEQVGMNLVKANPDAGTVIIKSLSDPRMPGWLGWQKY